MKRIDEKMMSAAIWGGSVLGGGGGGNPKAGYALAREALMVGQVYLALPEELPDESYTVTAGLVGSPKAGGLGPSPDRYVDAFLFLQKAGNLRVAAVNSNEAGGVATVNGWLQAAHMQVPVLDAPANGRAHPTGLMGAMGLHKDRSYISRQAAAGRNSKIYVEGQIDEASAIVRSFSEREGLVAVARNPVTCGYAAKYGARGAISQAIDLGFAMAREVRKVFGVDPLSPENVGGINTGGWVSRPGVNPGVYSARAAAEFLKGSIVMSGQVQSVRVDVKGGFDVGEVLLREVSWDTDSHAGEDALFSVSFMNEYLTLKKGQETFYSFPDLISFLSLETGWPISSAELKEGQRVIVIAVPKEHLILGDGMFDPNLYEPLEKAIGEKLSLPERRLGD